MILTEMPECLCNQYVRVSFTDPFKAWMILVLKMINIGSMERNSFILLRLWLSSSHLLSSHSCIHDLLSNMS